MMLNKNMYLYKLNWVGRSFFLPILYISNCHKSNISFKSPDKQNLISEPRNKQKQTHAI